MTRHERGSALGSTPAAIAARTHDPNDHSRTSSNDMQPGVVDGPDATGGDPAAAALEERSSAVRATQRTMTSLVASTLLAPLLSVLGLLLGCCLGKRMKRSWELVETAEGEIEVHIDAKVGGAAQAVKITLVRARPSVASMSPTRERHPPCSIELEPSFSHLPWPAVKRPMHALSSDTRTLLTPRGTPASPGLVAPGGSGASCPYGAPLGLAGRGAGASTLWGGCAQPEPQADLRRGRAPPAHVARCAQGPPGPTCTGAW